MNATHALLLARLAEAVVARHPNRRVRMAIDGVEGAGKTFGPDGSGRYVVRHFDHPMDQTVAPAAEQAREASRAPVLSREGISWRTRGDQVEVLIGVTNPGPRPTAPAQLIVEAAPLGAFVPGYPVGRLAVAAMDPGERRRLALTVGFADIAPSAAHRLVALRLERAPN